MRNEIWTRVRTFAEDMSGASMVEYGIALLVVAGLGVGVMTGIGTETGAITTAACNVVAEAPYNSSTC